MRIVTLRARAPGAVPIDLHKRVTVVAGSSAADRQSLKETFEALTEPRVPGLEALMELNGMTVPLDPAFAETYSLTAAPAAVLVVPGPGVEGADGPDVPEYANAERISSLRAQQRAAQSELTLVARALEQERSHSASKWSGRSVPDPASTAGPAERGVDQSMANVRELADQLAMELAERGGSRPGEVAELLEGIADRRASSRGRAAALAQLMAECQVAIESAQAAMHDTAHPSGSALADAAAEVEAVRGEMLRIAFEENMTRRQRRRLADLRSTERRLLAGLGHTSYSDLLASRAAEPDPAPRPDGGATSARLELLLELQDFWHQRQQQAAVDSEHEVALLAEGAALVGDSVGAGMNADPRLMAARLRAVLPGRSGANAPADLTATRLSVELGLDPGSRYTPREILEVAEAELEAAERSASPASSQPPRSRVGSGIGGDRERVIDLQKLEADLEARLRQVGERLAALERAANLAQPDSRAGVDLRSGGVSVVPDAADWSLVREIESRRPQPHVGTVPVLVMEPDQGPNALDQVDPLDVVALGATTQIVWITDRPEVIDAIQAVGNLGSVIRT